MHSLSEDAPPTVTVPSRIPAFQYHAAVCSLALSITAGSTVTHADYTKRVSLAPAVFRPCDDTTATWEWGRTKTDWLNTTVDAMLAQVPEEAWADVPDTSLIEDDI